MIQRNPTFKFDLTYPSMQPQVYQRLGEKQATDIVVQVMNDGKPFSLTGVRFGFELRNDKAKIIIDTNQTHFSVIDNANGIFRYRVTDEGFGYIGNSYLAYFTLTISDVRITTERFRFHNDEDVQVGADGLQEHYVSVIDDLVKSNAEALAKAQEIKAMIEANQVVKKSGDTMTGELAVQIPTSGDNGLSFKTTTGAYLHKLVGTNSGAVAWQDKLGNVDVLNYISTSKTMTALSGVTFNVLGATNLMKKSEIYSNWVTPDGRSIGINDSDLNTVISPGIYTGQRLVNAPEGLNNFFYIEVVPYTNTSYVMQRATILNNTNQRIWLRTLQNNVWQPWTEVTGRGKDGRADLILTADATNFDTSRAPISVRRGNTVSLRAAISMKSDAIGVTATKLPIDMRPTDVLTVTVLATDGTYHSISIHISGDVNFPATAKGKNIYLSHTYVVN